MSVRTGVECDWDVKGRGGAGTVDRVLGPGERACGLTMAASAIWGTWGGFGCAIDNVAPHGVIQFPEVKYGFDRNNRRKIVFNHLESS